VRPQTIAMSGIKRISLGKKPTSFTTHKRSNNGVKSRRI
jgi:hypothetical protein